MHELASRSRREVAFPTLRSNSFNSCTTPPGSILEADTFRKRTMLSLGRQSRGFCILFSVYPEVIQQSHFGTPLCISNKEDVNTLHGCRIGEALNPGPGNQAQEIVFTILNPTSIPERHEDIVNLNTDCISLVETSATSAVQAEFTKFLKTTNYRIPWGPPVPSQRQLSNPFLHDNAKRGAALGTASLFRIPHRTPRINLPTWLEETLRVSQQIVVIGHIEVLLITAYFCWQDT